MVDTPLVAGPRPIVAVARVILWAFFGIAPAVGFANLIGGGIAIGQHLASGYTQLTLVANKPLPRQLHPAAQFSVINGSYPTATLQARGLSTMVVSLVTIAAIATVLSQAGVALASGAAAKELNGGGNGFWPLAGRFDPTLAIFGIVLLLVGLAFEYGTRLQKETEGLV
ncbi:MAG TPA: hypothetical protein VHU90_11410 [Galbitalea sp.]|jgi:hypothetical protein|nr:hypothetical protein [Galbitalea sp.]